MVSGHDAATVAQVAASAAQAADAAAPGGLVGVVAGIAAGMGTLVTAATVLRRRLSRDATEMVKDRAEGSFVTILLAERDAAIATAREAADARAQDAAAIARLTAENEHRAREIARLCAEFAALKRMLLRVVPETAPFLSSGFAPPSLDTPPTC